MASQYIFNDGEMKSRLMNVGDDWYVAEWKHTNQSQWFPWICGTSAYLCLTDQEKAWAKNG